MERRSLLKWLGGFTAGILLASKTNTQSESNSNRAIAYTSLQSSTVWKLPDFAASKSALEYETLFKELFKQLP